MDVSEPSGPVPCFRQPASDGREWAQGVDVPKSCWRKLVEPTCGRIAQPSDVADSDSRSRERGFVQIGVEYQGKERLKRAWPSLVDESGEAFSTYPEIWNVQAIEAAKPKAIEIIREAGFDAALAGDWVFRDQNNDWWALSDHGSKLLGPEGGPTCWWVGGKHLAAIDLPAELFDALGGICGPLEWAFHVVETEGLLRRSAQRIEHKGAQQQKLMQLPEWSALEDAARRSCDDDINAALLRLHYLSTDGSSSEFKGVFNAGVIAGDFFGFARAAVAIRDQDAKRAKSGKTARSLETQNIILKLVTEKLKCGPVIPYQFGKEIVALRGSRTSQGEYLRSLHLPASADSIGRIAARVLKKAKLVR